MSSDILFKLNNETLAQCLIIQPNHIDYIKKKCINDIVANIKNAVAQNIPPCSSNNDQQHLQETLNLINSQLESPIYTYYEVKHYYDIYNNRVNELNTKLTRADITEFDREGINIHNIDSHINSYQQYIQESQSTSLHINSQIIQKYKSVILEHSDLLQSDNSNISHIYKIIIDAKHKLTFLINDLFIKSKCNHNEFADIYEKLQYESSLSAHTLEDAHSSYFDNIIKWYKNKDADLIDELTLKINTASHHIYAYMGNLNDIQPIPLDIEIKPIKSKFTTELLKNNLDILHLDLQTFIRADLTDYLADELPEYVAQYQLKFKKYIAIQNELTVREHNKYAEYFQTIKCTSQSDISINDIIQYINGVLDSINYVNDMIYGWRILTSIYAKYITDHNNQKINKLILYKEYIYSNQQLALFNKAATYLFDINEFNTKNEALIKIIDIIDGVLNSIDNEECGDNKLFLNTNEYAQIMINVVPANDIINILQELQLLQTNLLKQLSNKEVAPTVDVVEVAPTVDVVEVAPTVDVVEVAPNMITPPINLEPVNNITDAYKNYNNVNTVINPINNSQYYCIICEKKLKYSGSKPDAHCKSNAHTKKFIQWINKNKLIKQPNHSTDINESIIAVIN